MEQKVKAVSNLVTALSGNPFIFINSESFGEISGASTTKGKKLLVRILLWRARAGLSMLNQRVQHSVRVLTSFVVGRESPKKYFLNPKRSIFYWISIPLACIVVKTQKGISVFHHFVWRKTSTFSGQTIFNRITFCNKLETIISGQV